MNEKVKATPKEYDFPKCTMCIHNKTAKPEDYPCNKCVRNATLMGNYYDFKEGR